MSPTDATPNKILQVEDDSVYRVVEEMPRFLGCEDRPKEERRTCAQQKMLQYVYKNLKVDPIAREMGIEDTIVVTFIVEKDGSLNNIEMIKGGDHTNIIELIKKMPKWKPGIHKGILKKVRFNIPLKIHYQ